MKASRRKLPLERRSITHKFNIAGYGGILIVGMIDDGSPGEIFIKLSKAGSAMRGFTDGIALTTSMLLQRGVPLGSLVDKFAGTRFEPHGHSSNPQIGYASSILDYVFRYLEMKFPDEAKQGRNGGDSSGDSGSEGGGGGSRLTLVESAPMDPYEIEPESKDTKTARTNGVIKTTREVTP